MRIQRWVKITIIVVAAPVLLASALFPIFGRSRENACSRSCQSNLKQMGLGFMQYVQDCGSFPLATLGGPSVAKRESGYLTSGPRVGWADALEIYTKSR
jgi:Protein of unknown function (DUF1559)